MHGLNHVILGINTKLTSVEVIDTSSSANPDWEIAL